MKKYLLLVCSFFPVVLFAQIGINTENPTGTLSIVSPDNVSPIIKVENSDNNPLLTVDPRGYMGVGLSTPVTKLDLRSTTFTDNIIGLGTTTKTAPDAGAGGIRYNSGVLQFSDGTDWLSVSTISLEKAYVIANHTSTFSLFCPGAPGVMDVVSNWSIIDQKGTAFDAGTGKFTAPRSGIYSVSVTGLLTINNSYINSGCQLDIQTDNAIFPIAKSYVGNSMTVAKYDVTITNKAYIYLNAGEHIFTSIWFYAGTGSTLTLSTNPSHNILTITEM